MSVAIWALKTSWTSIWDKLEMDPSLSFSITKIRRSMPVFNAQSPPPCLQDYSAALYDYSFVRDTFNESLSDFYMKSQIPVAALWSLHSINLRVIALHPSFVNLRMPQEALLVPLISEPTRVNIFSFLIHERWNSQYSEQSSGIGNFNFSKTSCGWSYNAPLCIVQYSTTHRFYRYQLQKLHHVEMTVKLQWISYKLQVLTKYFIAFLKIVRSLQAKPD